MRALFQSNVLFYLCLFGSFTGLAAAQTIAGVRVYTEPAGMDFYVDGQLFHSSAMFLWPAASKHTLAGTTNMDPNSRTHYQVRSWVTNLGAPLSVDPITADPDLKYVKIVYDVTYAVTLSYFRCGDGNPECQSFSPGRVCINRQCYTGDTTQFFAPGSRVELQAYPAAGYIFTGWSPLPGTGKGSDAFLYSFPLNQPQTVTPMFRSARPLSISIDTSPRGLQVYADRTPMAAPARVEWGWDTVHTLGTDPVQRDAQGKPWVFASWSDGGELNHTFRIPGGSGSSITVTARFVQGATVSLLTSPPGLALTVDGRANWPNYTFIWAAGSRHALEAPAEQTDAHGRKYRFTGWSNGAAAAQEFRVAAAPDDVRLVAAYEPVGQVRVGSAPSGIVIRVDGQDCATPCVVERPVGTPVRVQAAVSIPSGEASRMDFARWSDGGASERTINATLDPANLWATYRIMNRLLMDTDLPEGAGWNVQPASPDGFYEANTVVSVQLKAKPGFRFRGWAGDLHGSTPAGALEMSAPRSIRALLERVPYVLPAGVRNAAGETPREAVAPGSIVSIFGASLAPKAEVGPATALPQTLGGITVRIGERLLPLLFVSPEQINAQLPSDLPEGEQELYVRWEGKPEVHGGFTAQRNAPGLFAYDSEGQLFAVAAHEDGSAVLPESPARRGELLTLFGTGLGPCDRPLPDGFAPPPGQGWQLADPFEVQVQDAPIGVAEAAPSASRAGVVEIRFRITGDALAAGNLPLRVLSNGVESNTVLIPVE